MASNGCDHVPSQGRIPTRLLQSGQSFGQSQCRIPIANCHLFVPGQRRNLADAALGGLGDQAGAIDDLGAGVGRVHARFQGELGQQLGGRGQVFQENHVIAILFGLAAEALGGFFEDALELGLGAQDQAGVVFESGGQRLFQAGDQLGGGVGGLEEDVAALDVGADGLQALGFEAGLQVGHFDDVLAADVDAAEEGDVGRHGGPEGC